MALSLSRPGADVYVPDGTPAEPALSRVTHLGIAAHADDLEIMAYHGIRRGREERAHFGGVVCTDGRGAPRAGAFARLSDDEMRQVRRDEQREAARRGGYAAVVQLDHASESVKSGAATQVVEDLVAVLRSTRPEVVYTHNPMDAHLTHLGVCSGVLDAIRRLAAAERPRKVLGCEGWRGLDWLPEADRTRLELGRDDADWSGLIRAFASQTEGGRPYDEGALGRARANAVFAEARESGGDERVWLALDLTPVTAAGGPELESFVRERLEAFTREVLEALARVRSAR
jgi:LmbE family N-acetylglucosaminyl deacetylase